MSNGMPSLSADKSFPFDELMRELRRLCTQGRSGTLFVATEDNRLARFVIREGLIIDIAFQRKSGLGAIEAIKSITSGTFRFSDQMMLVSAIQSLPPTAAILQMLAKEFNTPMPATPAMDIDLGALDTHMQTSPSLADMSDVLEIKSMIGRGLVEIMGPMGNLVCEEHLANLNDRRSVLGAIDRLAEEIGDAKLEQKFKAWVSEQLRKMSTKER